MTVYTCGQCDGGRPCYYEMQSSIPGDILPPVCPWSRDGDLVMAKWIAVPEET